MSEHDLSRHPALITRDGLVVVCVDIQHKLAAVMPRRDEVVATAARMVRAAGVLGAPVIVTRQYPQGLGDTVPGIGRALDEAGEAASEVTTVDKVAFDCTLEPAFMAALLGTGRAHVVLVGMETHICVTQTALSLAASGLTPHVAADAVCSRRDSDRDAALDRLRSAGVDVLTTESAIYEALGRAGTDEFKAVLRVIKEG